MPYRNDEEKKRYHRDYMQKRRVKPDVKPSMLNPVVKPEDLVKKAKELASREKFIGVDFNDGEVDWEDPYWDRPYTKMLAEKLYGKGKLHPLADPPTRRVKLNG